MNAPRLPLVLTVEYVPSSLGWSIPYGNTCAKLARGTHRNEEFEVVLHERLQAPHLLKKQIKITTQT